MAITITEILGSDSISGSRGTLNSNFTILQNWINSYSANFGLDLNNGVIDLTSQSTGKISAKIGAFNSINLPASGASKITLNSAGTATFVSLNTATSTFSSTASFNGNLNSNSVFNLGIGATGNFNGQVNLNSRTTLGPSSSLVNTSTVYDTGLTAGSAFPDNDSIGFPHGGGYVTTPSLPYVVTGTKNIIYADLGSTGGFNISVGDGSTVSALPAGLTLTIVNTNGSGGTINTGVQGSFYTGFNTNSSQGGFATGGILASSGYAYRSSLTLMWEPRIDQSSGTEKGSWIVLNSTNLTI